jgi:3-isopropylmalate dehydratase
MPGADKKPKTLYDKVLDHHIVNEQEDGTILLYIGMEHLYVKHRSFGRR